MKPSDIAFLKPGQEARIRISAYDLVDLRHPCPARCCASAPTPSPTRAQGEASSRCSSNPARTTWATPPSTSASRRAWRPTPASRPAAYDDGVHAQTHRQDPRQIPPRTLMRSPSPHPARRPAASASAASPRPTPRPLPAVVDKVLLQQPSALGPGPAARRRRPDHPGLLRLPAQRRAELPQRRLPRRNPGRPLDRNIRRSDASLRWNIFNGGADTAACRPAGLNRDAADADLDNVLEQVSYEITETYTDIVRLRHTVRQPDGHRRAPGAGRGRRGEAGRGWPHLAGRARPDARAPDPEPHDPRPAGPSSAPPSTATACSPARRRTARHPGDPPADGDTDIDALVERIHERNPRLRAALQRAAARKAEVGVARGSFSRRSTSYSKRLDNTTIPVPVSDTDRARAGAGELRHPLGGKETSAATPRPSSAIRPPRPTPTT